MSASCRLNQYLRRLRQNLLNMGLKPGTFGTRLMLYHCTTVCNFESTLTLSLIQQFCSKRLWTCFVKKKENLYNWMDNLWLKVENIVAKGVCSFWAMPSFVTMFSKSCLLQRHQKVSIRGKGLNGLLIAWLGRHFGIPSPSAVSQSCFRFLTYWQTTFGFLQTLLWCFICQFNIISVIYI